MQNLTSRLTKQSSVSCFNRFRDTVLKPSTIVKAFETCGYYPFDFTKSYAYKKIPPPIAKSPEVVEANHDKDWEEDREEPATPRPQSPVSVPLQLPEDLPPQSRPLRTSQTHPAPRDGTPRHQHANKHLALLNSLQSHMVAMQGNATPRWA